MDLAERVGWPRETSKWDLLFDLGRAYATTAEDGSLSSMVVIPAFEGVSFVAMMVVDPAFQGQGLGRKLLEHAMAASTPPFMLYATPRGRALYERLGFREVDGAQKHIGVARATTAPTAVRGAMATDHAAMIEADARAFGVRRSRLIEALLSRAERAVVDERGGYAIRWFNGALAVVGPVIAEDEEAAIALVEAALQGSSGPSRVDVPTGSPKLAAHVRSLGLEALGPAPLMTWPDALLPGDRGHYHALALQAFG